MKSDGMMDRALMKPAKNLIVAADDFGLTNRVNEAIAIACRDGVVTSASLMVTTPAFESAADIARREPKLDVGLHLNLTEGCPVATPSMVSTLADSGVFRYRHPVKLATAILRKKVSIDDLEREIRAQIEKALDAELWITHIDGHKHVQMIPSVFRILCRVVQDYGIFAIRSARERTPRIASMLERNRGSRRQILKQCAFAKLVSAAALISQRKTAHAVLVAPKRFYGITQTGFLDLASFADVVNDLDEGVHELMCHPGFVDDDLNTTPTRLRIERERELELLTGSDVRDLLRQNGVALISYRDLVEKYGNGRPDSVLHRYSAL